MRNSSVVFEIGCMYIQTRIVHKFVCVGQTTNVYRTAMPLASDLPFMLLNILAEYLKIWTVE